MQLQQLIKTEKTSIHRRASPYFLSVAVSFSWLIAGTVVHSSKLVISSLSQFSFNIQLFVHGTKQLRSSFTSWLEKGALRCWEGIERCPVVEVATVWKQFQFPPAVFLCPARHVLCHQTSFHTVTTLTSTKVNVCKANKDFLLKSY